MIPRNNAQELPTFEKQTEAEISYANRGLGEDFGRFSTASRIQKGRDENKAITITESSELQGNVPRYSKDFEILRFELQERNNDRYSAKYTNDRSTVTELPILFRRPGSEANNTLLSQFIRRNEFSGVPVPIIYFQNNPNVTSDSSTSGGDQVYAENLPNESILTIPETSSFYTNAFISSSTPQSTFNSDVENFKIEGEEKQIALNTDQRYTELVPEESATTNTGNFETLNLYRNYQVFPSPFNSPSQYNLNSNIGSNAEPTQISSSLIDKPSNFESITSRTSEELIQQPSTEERRREQIIPTPMDIYRSQRFFPPMAPAYFPRYPFVPYQRDGRFLPMLPYLPNGQTFDREPGTGIGQRIPEVVEKQILPLGSLNENLPSETTATNIPPALSYPMREYPFGLYPPPFPSPMVPNIPQPGFLLNPYLPPPGNVPRGNINVEASQPPLVPVVPTPDVAPVVPPQIDNLRPEAESDVIETPEISRPEGAVPVDEASSEKIPYAFGFDMNDGKGNDQHRKEVSDVSGLVTGSYAFRNGDGHYRVVYYIADKDGFRAFVHSNEPGVASSGSANVVVVAEKPPPKERVEGSFPESKDDLTLAGSVQESQ